LKRLPEHTSTVAAVAQINRVSKPVGDIVVTPLNAVALLGELLNN